MVYCGKPSKGCSVCRERKVRCDQKEPSCGQCLKRGHQCPGYRNLVDLMFRDESNHVIKKATNTRSRVAKTANQTTQTDSTASEAKEPLPASSFAPRSAPRRTSPIVHQILHPRQRPEPSPPSSSPRSTSSLRIVQEPKAKSRRQPQRQTRTRRFGSYNHSTLLGVLTPQSGRVSSIASDDSRSDDERETGIHQLVFNYYDPELDTCVPQLQLDGAEGEDTDSTDEGEDSLKPPGSLTYSLSPSLCERGTAFFFSRYVSVEPSCHQGFDFIYEIWKPPQHSGAYFASTVDGVTASMIAVGLAGLSKLTGSREAQVQAQHSYGIALNLTNAALRDPAKCATDSTMLAVLILGTYEFLAGRSPQTMSAWQEHVSGAAALASMRGKAQFATNAGTRMFLMLCHSVLVNCIQSGLPMPHSMVQLRIELVRRSESQGASWRLAEPIYRALQARYDINIGLITNLDEIIEKLTDIDNEFADLLAGLPESWSYRSVRLQQDNPAAFGRFCHIYGGLQQVTLWNGLRTVRMLVHETILEQLCTYASTFLSTSMLPEHYQHLLVKTMSMLEMLGDAIIASVPQHFGVVSSRNVDFGGSRKGSSPLPHETETIKAVLSRTQSRSSTPPQTTVNPAFPAPTGPTLFDPMKAPGGEGIAERFMTLASTSNTILWPLYVLGMSSSCSQEKRDYVLDRLDAVYQETKLDQARIVSRLLESKTASVAWDSIPLTQLPSLPAESLLRAV